MSNFISMDKRVAVISALVEGCSVRATVRMTGVSKGAILRLLESVGTACAEYQDQALRNLPATRIQCDEIWSFVAAKQKNVTSAVQAREPMAGDVWTWVAMDSDTKLACTWVVGSRDAHTARVFVRDLKSRLANRVQLTTDGLKHYFHAIAEYFDDEVDYATLTKIYGATTEESGANVRYSPARCLGTETKVKIGNPDPKFINTSYIERQNLTMRMQMRRYTRLTNAFSKNLTNHIHSVNLFYMWYNFARVHQTLRVTPAMEAGLSSRVWSVREIVELAFPQEMKLAA
jgi:IS1 family transposase